VRTSLLSTEHAVRDNAVAEEVESNSDVVVVSLKEALVDLEVSKASLHHVSQVFNKGLISFLLEEAHVGDSVSLFLAYVRLLQGFLLPLDFFLRNIDGDVVLNVLLLRELISLFVAYFLNLGWVETLNRVIESTHEHVNGLLKMLSIILDLFELTDRVLLELLVLVSKVFELKRLDVREVLGVLVLVWIVE
jgi:hypothetical protein